MTIKKQTQSGNGEDKKDEDYFKQQMEAQRLAFERQFGSLESMGYDDKTKKESDEELDSSSDDFQNGSDADGSMEGGSDDDNLDSEEELDRENREDDGDEEEKEENNSSSTPLSIKNAPQPKVIKFNFGAADNVTVPVVSKADQKLLKSGKSTIVKPKSTTMLKGNNSKQNNNNDSDSDAEVEADNLQKDIELQNFIKDSHLLASFDPQNSSTSSGVPVHGDDMFGKVRMKALEQRFVNMRNSHANVSAKKKQASLESVPMNIRKGMLNKHMKRIEKHEEFAKENGIILSKVAKGKFRKIDFTYKKDIERRIGDSNKSKEKSFKKQMHRDKGLKINSVGRSTRNGLVISKNEIARINGEGNNDGNKKRKGGKGKKSFGKKRR